MADSRWASIGMTAVLALAMCASAAAQDKQLYRYIDASGKVVYSDTPPPADAKNVQPKRLGSNVIESNEVPLAARMASERFPVTLYTFDCGEPCRRAEALLNRRGVPFTSVNVTNPEGGAKLMSLTGANLAPVMQIGDKLLAKGLNESQWEAMLDQAGYPRTPTPRVMPAGKGTEAPPMAKGPPPAATVPAPAAPAVTTAPTSEGGYPK
jgi:glutaredoxin